MTDLIAKLNRAFCALFFSLALALSCMPVSAIVAPRAYADDAQEAAAAEVVAPEDELQEEPEANATDQEQATDEAQEADPDPVATAQEEPAATSLTPQAENGELRDSGTFNGGRGKWEYRRIAATSEDLDFDYVLEISTADNYPDSTLSLADIDSTGWGQYKTFRFGVTSERNPECITKIRFSGSGKVKLPENATSLFSGYTQLRSIDFGEDVVDASETTSMYRLFKDCKKLKSVNINAIKSSVVTDISEMFMNCNELASIGMSKFDTSSVTDMSNLFSYCGALKTLVDIKSFDTSNVTSMHGMFEGCGELNSLNLSNFNTRNVTDMSNMFFLCRSLHTLNLTSFNTQNVTAMNKMFCECLTLTDLNISSFDTSSVIDMNQMFQYCSSISSLDLKSFNTQNVTNMSYMFQHCDSLSELDLLNFDTSKVTDMTDIFDFNINDFRTLILGENFHAEGAQLPAVDGWYSIPTGETYVRVVDTNGNDIWYPKSDPSKQYKDLSEIVGAEGSSTGFFKTPINLADLQKKGYLDIEVVDDNCQYDGTRQIPKSITVKFKIPESSATRTLIPDTDYSVTYISDTINATRAGETATIEINGKKPTFNGIATASYTIKQQPIDGGVLLINGNGPKDKNNFDYEIDSQAYTGQPVEPTFTVTFQGKELVKDVDYYVNYANNTDPGKAWAVITGTGNYKGPAKVVFQIVGTKPTNTTEVKSPSVSGTWKKSGSRWWYAYDSATKLAQNKEYPANEWVTIGGKRYHFDSSGWMHTGWQKIGNNWFFLGSDGALKTGWVRSGSKWYYMEKSNGVMQTGWFTDTDGKKYFLDTSGSGHMKTGWQKISDKWYFFTSAGNMLYKWQRIGGKWYYLDAKTGAMQTGLLKDGNTEYFLNSPNGDMATGWRQIEKTDDKNKTTKSWYYFDKSGAMVKSAWRSEGGKWYYLDATGAMVTGTQKIGTDTYFFSTSGVMHKGWNKENSYWYYYGSSGARIKDQWMKSGGYWYHFSKSTGAMQTNWYTDDKGDSYFLDEGRMIADAHVSLDDGVTGKKYYYFDKSGVMAKEKWVNGYYYGKDGLRVVNDWVGNYHVGADGKIDQTR